MDEELTDLWAHLLTSLDGSWEYEYTDDGIRLENSAGNIILAPNLLAGLQAALALYEVQVRRNN